MTSQPHMTSHKSKPIPETGARLTRRQFFKHASMAAAAPMILPASVLGLNGAVAPSNRIVFGCIGVGARARHVMPSFLAQPDIVFAAVSDCREDRLRSAKVIMDTHYGNKDCRMYPDFRELLAQQDIDAVFIATGDRWHTTASVWARAPARTSTAKSPSP